MEFGILSERAISGLGGRHLGMLSGDYCTWSTSLNVEPGGTVQFGTRTFPERFCMRSRDLMKHCNVYLEVVCLAVRHFIVDSV